MNERAAAGQQKPANGQLCLNYLSHPRGQVQNPGSNPRKAKPRKGRRGEGTHSSPAESDLPRAFNEVGNKTAQKR